MNGSDRPTALSGLNRSKLISSLTESKCWEIAEAATTAHSGQTVKSEKNSNGDLRWSALFTFCFRNSNLNLSCLFYSMPGRDTAELPRKLPSGIR
jgi:hypothetical protein